MRRVLLSLINDEQKKFKTASTRAHASANDENIGKKERFAREAKLLELVVERLRRWADAMKVETETPQTSTGNGVVVDAGEVGRTCKRRRTEVPVAELGFPGAAALGPPEAATMFPAIPEASSTASAYTTYPFWDRDAVSGNVSMAWMDQDQRGVVDTLAGCHTMPEAIDQHTMIGGASPTMPLTGYGGITRSEFVKGPVISNREPGGYHVPGYSYNDCAVGDRSDHTELGRYWSSSMTAWHSVQANRNQNASADLTAGALGMTDAGITTGADVATDTGSTTSVDGITNSTRSPYSCDLSILRYQRLL